MKAGFHLDEPIPSLNMTENLRGMREIVNEWRDLEVDVAVNLITSGGSAPPKLTLRHLSKLVHVS
ncbi:TPA: hypothetical protein EYP27_02465 [Candidatus Bathyarchaeota archaeon]|nr:hypothetical protein [Candidatus Bathyarchaeota archaeon]